MRQSETSASPTARGSATHASAGGGAASGVSPATPAGVRRVLSRLREVGGEVAGNVAAGLAATASPKEENSKEMNRRLQALLEETLLKNINLQQDVENLSYQVQHLTQLAAAAADSDANIGQMASFAPSDVSQDSASCDALADESLLDELRQCGEAADLSAK